MYISDIRVEASKAIPKSNYDFVFRWTTHHVRQIFLHFIGRRFVLDGSAVFQITCGPKPEHAIKGQLLGSTEHYVEDFDFDAYRSESPSEREQTILKLIQEVMKKYCNNATAQEEIDKAIHEVIEHQFQLRISVAKLSRLSNDKQLKLMVYRNLGAEVGETWTIDIINRGGSLIGTECMTSSPCFLDRTTHFSKSRWQGNVFEIIYQRLQKVEYSLDTSKYKDVIQPRP